jgi:16S rRNA (cytosine967-C5)-methyltransferase
MSISPARKIAYEVLRRVEAEGAYASDALHTELGARVSSADAALATEIALGVLRWQRLLDFLLDRQLKKPVARLDLPVAIALRMGLYQLRFLERVPARAAVHESVELVKQARKASAGTLVNAVLRRLQQDSKANAEELLPLGISPAERLGILHSHPTWMVERWLARLGEIRTVALLEANNRAPRQTGAFHFEGDDDSGRAETVRALEAAGMHVEPGRLLKSAFAASGGSPSRTEAFRKGWISIQDEASQAVPLLLDVHAGDRVLDLCAAPGGKTPPLVRAAGSEGTVIAADHHAHRLRAMRAQFERLALERVHLVELDAANALPFGGGFQRILVDAPCTGTGTLARHPEIRWRLRPQQLAELHKLQVEILSQALSKLSPGGRLVYSTCSLEPEENEEVVAEALLGAPGIQRASRGVGATALAGRLAEGIPAVSLFDDSGYFRTMPGEQPTDGFFAGLLQRD